MRQCTTVSTYFILVLFSKLRNAKKKKFFLNFDQMLCEVPVIVHVKIKIGRLQLN